MFLCSFPGKFVQLGRNFLDESGAAILLYLILDCILQDATIRLSELYAKRLCEERYLVKF